MKRTTSRIKPFKNTNAHFKAGIKLYDEMSAIIRSEASLKLNINIWNSAGLSLATPINRSIKNATS